MSLKTAALAAAVAALAGTAMAQEAAFPRTIPAPGGAVIIPTPGQQAWYDESRFAPARRVGDTLYVSGLVLFRLPTENTDAAAFEEQTRRAYRQLDRVLKAGGSSWDNVVMINSFHLFDSPNFAGTRDEQFEIMGRVRAEFTTAPHPAWTAVGTSGLLAPNGIVEIQVIAHVPQG